MVTTPEEDRLIQNLRMQLPGALDDIIKFELFNVYDEFFKNTNVWTEDVTFVTVEGRQDYIVENSAQTRVHRLDGVYSEDLTTQYPATMVEPGLVVLTNEVTAEVTLVARLICTVLDPANEDTGLPTIPEALLKNHYLCFVHGCLSRMMNQPAKPYSNERLAVYHGRKFRDMMAIARGDQRRANMMDGQRWRFPRGFV